MQTRKEGRKK